MQVKELKTKIFYKLLENSNDRHINVIEFEGLEMVVYSDYGVFDIDLMYWSSIHKDFDILYVLDFNRWDGSLESCIADKVDLQVYDKYPITTISFYKYDDADKKITRTELCRPFNIDGYVYNK